MDGQECEVTVDWQQAGEYRTTQETRPSATLFAINPILTGMEPVRSRRLTVWANAEAFIWNIFILKTEAAHSSETSVQTYTTLCKSSEGHRCMGNNRHVNLKTYTNTWPVSLSFLRSNTLPATSDIIQDCAQVIVHGLCVVKLWVSRGSCSILCILTYLLTYLLTYSMEHSPSSEANQFSAKQEIPRIFGTRKFITAFTIARHLSLSWASSIQSMPPHPTSWRSILILSSHLHLGLPSGLFPTGSPTKTLYTPLFFHIYATCPAHLILLDFITRLILGEQYRSLSSSLCSFPLSCYLVLLRPKYSPQHPVLKHPQPTFPIFCIREIFLYLLKNAWRRSMHLIMICRLLASSSWENSLK